MSGGEHHDVSGHVKAYLAVLVALVIGTVLTVWIAEVHIAHPWNYVVGLAIACTKASLVAAIFMHLKWERSMNLWMVFAISAIFFAALMMLPVLTSHDLPPQAVHRTWSEAA